MSAPRFVILETGMLAADPSSFRIRRPFASHPAMILKLNHPYRHFPKDSAGSGTWYWIRFSRAASAGDRTRSDMSFYDNFYSPG
jgi:hypothetical protein